LLDELRADRVHVLMAGQVVASGGPELAQKLEETGYEGLAAELGVDTLTVDGPAPEADPFADAGF
jgi:Fe-S cluster assembly ATP-binding protein